MNSNCDKIGVIYFKHIMSSRNNYNYCRDGNILNLDVWLLHNKLFGEAQIWQYHWSKPAF